MSFPTDSFQRSVDVLVVGDCPTIAEVASRDPRNCVTECRYSVEIMLFQSVSTTAPRATSRRRYVAAASSIGETSSRIVSGAHGCSSAGPHARSSRRKSRPRREPVTVTQKRPSADLTVTLATSSSPAVREALRIAWRSLIARAAEIGMVNTSQDLHHSSVLHFLGTGPEPTRHDRGIHA